MDLNELRWGTRDVTRYAIVALAPYTASGFNEIQATFIKKMTAEAVLKEYVPIAQERRNRYAIVRLERK